MFGLFKKKTPGVITLSLNAKLQPMHRAELEDAFRAFCEQQQIKANVVGGGTFMGPSGEVKECDIEIELEELNDKSIARVAEVMEAMLAPKGSRIQVPGREPLAFGHHEGLGLYLNGTDLPDEVYETCDSNVVYDECSRLLEGVAMVNSHWQGPTESALYMYGQSFETIRERIQPLLDSYPLCQRCRVERIA